MNNQTAQELVDSCNGASPMTPTVSDVFVTLPEYNQVVAGVRMQLHLFSKQNQRLTARLKESGERMAYLSDVINAAYNQAVDQPQPELSATASVHPLIREVHDLRIRLEESQRTVKDRETTCDSLMGLLKARDRNIRKLRNGVRKSSRQSK